MCIKIMHSKKKQDLDSPGVFLLLSSFDFVAVVVLVAVAAVVVTFPMGSIYRIFQISLNLVDFLQ